MAAASCTMLLRRTVGHLVVRTIFKRLSWVQNTRSTSLLQPERLPFRVLSTEANQAGATEPDAFELESQFKEKPWEYLESEEYIEKYASNPVWFGYRRNHKGQIPPQKTRKTCIRKNKVCGNPCPICRDRNLFLDYRNIKLLEQFICPHTGIIYHPTRTAFQKNYRKPPFHIESPFQKAIEKLYPEGRGGEVYLSAGEIRDQLYWSQLDLRASYEATNPLDAELLLGSKALAQAGTWSSASEDDLSKYAGICRKKYKQLTEAIQQARDNGLLFFYIPFTDFKDEDFSNQHPAVTKTLPSPALQGKAAWYEWYEWQQPPEKEINRIRRIYKNYLKEESSLA